MPRLDDAQTRAIGEIQRKVRAMLDERQANLPADPAGQPSRYWTDFCSYFDYMLDLAPDAFSKLRLHTYHLTGDNYQTYYFGALGPFLNYWGPWLDAEGLPTEHRLSEPEGGIGFRLDDGRLVSQDIARFQRSISTLSRRGVLAALANRDAPPRLIEIGGGYGGLGLHLARMLPGVRYVLVDLPETLIFSAAYLTLHAPGRRVWLYEPGATVPPRDAGFDFILLPDYRLADLDSETFDLAVNLASLQEMRVDQVGRYLDFLAPRLPNGLLYSCNRDRQNRNDELPGLFDLLRVRFRVEEVPPLAARPRSRKARVRDALRLGARALGLGDPSAPATDPYPFVEHLCYPANP